jgi:3-hydroxyacyl-CoA dehydrogenase
MHFFNPVPLMSLVEVIPGPMTAPDVVDRVALLARRLAKTPVIAADTPGFIVNRVQRALYLEAFRILEEGVGTLPAIDEAMRQLGFRLGPFELADVVGTDVNLAAGTAIFEGYYGDPRYRPAQVQRRVVDAGRLGRKSGDVAMRLASNWPEGPIAWGERIGLASVVHTLDALHAAVPDGRYRVTPLLRALAMTGGTFLAA